MAYSCARFADPAQSLESASLLKKYGGKVLVIGPTGVRRDSYNFKEHKDDIVTTLNEFGKALADIGITGCLHQHTGTCIETRDEVLRGETLVVRKRGDASAARSSP
jgi:inosose dehydratase